MNALHYQYVLVLQPHPCSLKPAASLFEVEFRQLDFLPVKQLVQLLPEEVKVHRIEGLKVKLAVFVLWRVFAVHEIVVQFNHLRVQAENPALQGESLGCGCLSAA